MTSSRSIGFSPWGLLVLAPLLAGCSSFRTDMGRPLASQPADFTEQKTTVASVMHDLGAPDTVGKLPNGFAFFYEYSRMDEFQLGFSLDLPIIRYLKFIHAINHMDHQVLLLTFDGHGVLQSTGFSSWKEHLGGGNGVQFVFADISLSDSSVYLYPSAAHGWGQSLLQSPEITLNSAQNLRTGANGLQQRSVPNYVGQQTLEMSVPKTEKEKQKIKHDYQNQ